MSRKEAAALLGWTYQQMGRKIRDDEIQISGLCWNASMRLEDVVSFAMEQWPLEVIEQALGADARIVLPRGLRTKTIHLRLPRHHVAILEHLMAKQQVTASQLLHDVIEELAYGHIDELSTQIPGFDTAFYWPYESGHRQAS